MALTVKYPAVLPGVIAGTWTHTAGDAMESITVRGSLLGALFFDNDTNGNYDSDVKWSESLSGSVNTVTIYTNATVTAGKFILWVIPE
jgi:hypothetical protein